MVAASEHFPYKSIEPNMKPYVRDVSIPCSTDDLFGAKLSLARRIKWELGKRKFNADAVGELIDKTLLKCGFIFRITLTSIIQFLRYNEESVPFDKYMDGLILNLFKDVVRTHIREKPQDFLSMSNAKILATHVKSLMGDDEIDMTDCQDFIEMGIMVEAKPRYLTFRYVCEMARWAHMRVLGDVFTNSKLEIMASSPIQFEDLIIQSILGLGLDLQQAIPLIKTGTNPPVTRLPPPSISLFLGKDFNVTDGGKCFLGRCLLDVNKSNVALVVDKQFKSVDLILISYFTLPGETRRTVEVSAVQISTEECNKSVFFPRKKQVLNLPSYLYNPLAKMLLQDQNVSVESNQGICSVTSTYLSVDVLIKFMYYYIGLADVNQIDQDTKLSSVVLLSGVDKVKTALNVIYKH